MAFDNRTDLVAVNIEIANSRTGLDKFLGRLNPAVQAKRQAKPCCVDIIDNPCEIRSRKPRNVQNGAKILAVQIADRADFDNGRGDIETGIEVKMERAL